MRPPHLAPVLLIVALCAAPAAAAIAVDGALDVGYGAALVTQTTQTGHTSIGSIGDNTLGDVFLANGSELDEGYGIIADGVLHLFLSGNQAIQPNPSDPGTFGEYALVFVDAGGGGQSELAGLAPGWEIWGLLNGLRFDAGFDADYGFQLAGNTLAQPPTVVALQIDLAAPAPIEAVFLGSGAPGGPGTLGGGTNPHGIEATLDNRNVAGVTFGCGAASGAGVATGVEWAIPLAAVGDPAGCVKVCAFVVDKRGSMTNQVLGPLPVGTCPPGVASGVDFAAIAGDQYFTVCPGSVPVRAGTWGAVKASYR